MRCRISCECRQKSERAPAWPHDRDAARCTTEHNTYRACTFLNAYPHFRNSASGIKFSGCRCLHFVPVLVCEGYIRKPQLSCNVRYYVLIANSRIRTLLNNVWCVRVCVRRLQVNTHTLPHVHCHKPKPKNMNNLILHAVSVHPHTSNHTQP